MPYWAAAVTVGLISTVYTKIFQQVSSWSRFIYGENHFLPFIVTPACFLLGWALVKYFAPSAGGIFAPSLAMGASIGAEISKFVGTDHATLTVLLGMTGFLAGVTHCPFTSFVLILEMTDHHSAIFPLMLAALTAYAAARAVDRISFYERTKEIYLR